MGCYRYQDVPTVPIEGLFCLLWDVPENRQRRVIKSLQDRSLVDCENGEFWLHPVVREEAIDRLRTGEDWVTANCKAAEFWTKAVKSIETTENALMALEAYYHCIHISDFPKAAEILIKQRANKWESGEPLGQSLYRLGLLQQPISAISSIIDKLPIGFPASKLHNILGDLYCLIGNSHKAIKCHEESGKIAKEAIHLPQEPEKLKSLERLKAYALFNVGLCKIDLWEIQEALTYIEESKFIGEDNNYKSNFPEEYYMGVILCSLAFLYACIGSEEIAFSLASRATGRLSETELDTGSMGYSFLFLGHAYKWLKEAEKSSEMYDRAILFSKETNYIQIKALALCGLSELLRDKKDCQTAISNCLESIEILKNVGAKCDLANAYYQLGLTYQAMGEANKSYEIFQEAIRLFTEMEAPKQVERVRKSMQNLN